MANNPFKKLDDSSHPLAHMAGAPSGNLPDGKDIHEEIIQVTLHLQAVVDQQFLEDDTLYNLAKRHIPKKLRKPLVKKLAPIRVVPMVVSFAAKYNLLITGVNMKQRWVRLSGPIRQFEKAFHTTLHTFEHHNQTIRINASEIHIHELLGNLVESVTGLTKLNFTPKMYSFKDMGKQGGVGGAMSGLRGIAEELAGRSNTEELTTNQETAPQDLKDENLAEVPPETTSQEDSSHDHKVRKRGWNSLLPSEWEKIYNFPPHLDGTGSTIAILAMGGGYEDKYLKQYFDALGMPMPDITWQPVTENAKNQPTPKPTDGSVWFDYEVYMDIQIAAAMAPGAKIVVYFTEDANPSEFTIAMKAIMADKKNDVDIVSISYGVLEYMLLGSEKNTLNKTMREAALQGITVIASSGDYGSSGNSTWNLCNPQLPASSPYVLAVGGTQLINASFEDHYHNVLDETFEWEGQEHHISTGGGFSTSYELPSYQEEFVTDYLNKFVHAEHTPPKGKRAYPDVGATASTNPGIYIQVAGEDQVGCGTSASAPLWAALIARINQQLKTKKHGIDYVGLIHPYLYQMVGTKAFRPQEDGNNGTYHALTPWNPCTGLGTPNGVAILKEIERLIKESRQETIENAAANAST